MSRERAGKTEACRVIEPGTKHCPVQWKREREVGLNRCRQRDRARSQRLPAQESYVSMAAL